MKYFLVLVTLLSLTACGKSAEKSAADDYAARVDAAHKELEQRSTPEGAAAYGKKLRGVKSSDM